MGDDSLSLGDRKAVQTELEKRKEEASFFGWVDKTEGPKKEKVILVIGKSRMILLRSGGKVAREAHWLELIEIKSSAPEEVHLGFKTFKIGINYSNADEIINKIIEAVDTAFPGVPQNLKFKLEVAPANRVRGVQPPEQPLGGFINTYKAMCDYFSVEVREDVIWDMENLFVPGQIKDFNLKEFEQPFGFNEVRTLIGTLQYNTYFRSLIAKNIPFDKNMVGPVAEALKFNTSLDELILCRIGLNKEGITAISEALSFNKTLALTSINLSQNNLEDRGMSALSNYIGGLNRGLVRLDLSNCGIGKAGIAALGSALKRNVHMSSTLTYFNISNNKMESEGSGALAAFLANPNVLRHLNISNTNAQLDLIVGAILRGCSELAVLDLSGNKFTRKETPSLCKFLQASASLSLLNISNTAATVESVKDIITATSSNPYLKDFSFNLASNKLGVPGARVLASLADKLNNIASLDLSDNELGDEGIAIVTEGLCYNTHLKRLSLDANFKNKTKGRNHAIESLINLVSSECPLEHLSLQGGSKSELKTDLIPFLYSLGTNETLQSLDVSGNQMGNKGASALGKALQTNDTIETLAWDGNLTTAMGFQSFHTGMKRNHSLKTMPMPVNDISAALKGSEATQVLDIVKKLEQTLQRNQSPTHKFQQTQDIGGKSSSSFAFLSSGAREELQKVLFKIKSTGRKVTDSNSRLVLEEAENQDQIMTSLYNIDEEIHQAFEHQLKKQLIAFTKANSNLYGKMKADMISQLLQAVQKNYKCFPQDIIKRLQTTLAYTGKEVNEEEFERVLVNQAASELSAKAAQAFHSTVTTASDYLYEKMQDLLMDIADELTSEVQQDMQATKVEVASAPSSSKPPSKPPPKTPSKIKSSSKKPAVPGRDKKPTTDVHVEALPKAETNLQHVTKGRQGAQGRRPPTRKPRPAPPSEREM